MSYTDEDRAVAMRALACLDLTNLNDDCSEEDIRDLIASGSTRQGSVAAVCIWPRFVAMAAPLARRAGMQVATVVNFPEGDHPVSEVMALTETAIADGATEIDMVIPWKLLLEGHPENVSARVARVKAAAGSAPVKAIIESGMLDEPDIIRDAAIAAIDGGADFIKTSTGKVPINATTEAAEVILGVIADAERPVGFKASGGVRTVDDAAAYLDIADRIMGADWARPSTFRFGASGLLDALKAVLHGTDAPESGQGY